MDHRVLLDDIAENREAFVALHGQSDHYGGSSVANICGLGYDSPLKEWLRRTGKEAPIEATPQMNFGNYMEPLLATMLYERIKLPVASVNQVWQHKEYDWMMASPDAVVDGEGLAEFKVHKIYADKYWSEDTASDSAMCQLQWYLAVSGLGYGYCCALIGGDMDKFYTPRFEADKGVQSQLIEQVEKFRELVKADIPPSAGPGDSKLIQDHLRKDYDKEKQIDLSETHSAKIERYRELAKQTDLLAQKLQPMEDEKKAIRNQFLADCEGAGTVLVGKDSVRLTQVVKKPSTTKGSTYFKVTVKLEDEG